MSQRYTVTALDRSSIGHPNYHRAGRSWPSGQEVEVEVLDQDDDPLETTTVKGETRVFAHPTKIGRESWAAIVRDKQLIKQPVGATVNEALALQAAYDAMKAELGRTLTRAEMAESALAERNAGVDRLNVQLDEARAKIAELEEQLATPGVVKAQDDAAKADEQTPAAKGKGSKSRG
jgi:hypothetical protein